MNRAFLFPLSPISLGSDRVESFTSFLIRLAAQHAMSLGRLIHLVCARAFPEDPLRAKRALACHIGTFVRPNHTTADLVAATANGLGVPEGDIRRTTFLALMPALARPQSAFSPIPKWCPQCLADAQADGTPPHFKLLWQLTDVDGCDIHRIALADRCPWCRSPQSGVGLRDSCAQCAACGRTLNGRGASRPAASWKCGTRDLQELVDAIGRGEPEEFPPRGVANVVNHLFERVWASNEEYRLWRLLPRDECLRFADGIEPVTLLTARRIASRLGMPLVMLLCGQAQESNGCLVFESSTEIPPALRRRKRKRLPRRQLLRERLQRLKASGVAPVSLSMAARAVGSSVGAIRYHFPSHARQIADAHAAWRCRKAAETAAAVRQAVLDALTRVSLADANSRKALLRQIRATTKLPKFAVRAEIARVFDALANPTREA